MAQHESEDLRKEQILKSAFNCFSKRGFEMVTMEEIAKDAGLSKGAVYWHFKSKDDLIMALIKNWMKRGENVLYKMALEYPLDQLLYKYPSYVITQMDLKNHYKFFFHLWARSIENKEVLSPLVENFNETREKAVAFVKVAIEKKLFRPDIDPEALSDTVDAMFYGLMIQWHLDKKMDFEKSWKAAIDMLIEGIKAKKES